MKGWLTAILCLAAAIGAVAPSCAAGEENPMIKQATKAGVKKCLPAIKNISGFIIKDGSSGVSSTWSSKNPDQQMFTSIIERTFTDGSMVSDVTVVHTASGECAVTYSKLYYDAKSCLAVSKDDSYKDLKYRGELNKNVVALQDSDSEVFLMPAGTGCIIIRKETLLNVTK